jgi:membrane-associated PAP2 superfamily phosphatase
MGIQAKAMLTGITLAWIASIALWELLDADRRVMSHLADASGFALRESWLLRSVLHSGLRYLSQVGFVVLVIAIWKPIGFLRGMLRTDRVGIAFGVALSAATISVIKYFSLTSCPWDLAQFGGSAQYVSHWAWGVADGGPGRCFPSGHASAGFAFLPLALPALLSADPARQAVGWRIFCGVVLFGLVCGITQVLRGAHYPSHVLWSGFICWIVAMISVGLATRLAARRA